MSFTLNNGMRFSPNMGLGQPTYSAPPPPDPRTPFTGALLPNGGSLSGGQGTPYDPAKTAATFSQGTPSELAGHPGGQYSGYYPQPGPPQPPGQMAPETWFLRPQITNGMQPQHFQTNGVLRTDIPQSPMPAQMPKPHDPTMSAWGGGFGKSDNSAWGNALGAQLESITGNSARTASNQPGGHVNQALPPGYGSVFGMGGGAGK